MSARVTLAVLTYDGRELLDRAMPSIVGQDFADRRVLVIDNGSSDGTAEHVASAWPEVDVLRIERNDGVSAGLNRGLDAADGEFVAILNNDIELAPDWLSRLVAALDAHPEAGSASGKVLRFDERDRIDTAGDWLLWSSAAVNRGHLERDRGQYDEPGHVFAACAGIALYRRTAFERVGRFDERYWAYLEDVDWAMRSQLAGLRSWYEPAAVAWHMGGATTARDPRRYARLQVRNQLWLVAKLFPARALLRHGPKIALHHLLWLAADARAGALRQHLGAWADAVRGLPSVLRARRGMRRTATYRELDKIIRAGMPRDTGPRERLAFELAPATVQRRRAASD
jgi:GT2 family glycosyltransferase